MEGGKELSLEGGRWKEALVWKVKGGKELRYGRCKGERSYGMEGVWWKGGVVRKVYIGKEVWYGR